MTEADNILSVVNAIKKVPPKNLLILELANTLPRKYGELDYDEVSNRQVEINLAISEAKAYGTNTIRAVEVLVRLQHEDGV